MPKTEYWHWYVERFAPTEAHQHAVEEVYFAGRTAFQDVAVLRSAAFGKMLVIDGDTQSSQADERIYHESLVHPAPGAPNSRGRSARRPANSAYRRQ
jgi:spermidine synthase